MWGTRGRWRSRSQRKKKLRLLTRRIMRTLNWSSSSHLWMTRMCSLDWPDDQQSPPERRKKGRMIENKPRITMTVLHSEHKASYPNSGTAILWWRLPIQVPSTVFRTLETTFTQVQVRVSKSGTLKRWNASVIFQLIMGSSRVSALCLIKESLQLLVTRLLLSGILCRWQILETLRRIRMKLDVWKEERICWFQEEEAQRQTQVSSSGI